MSSNRLSQTGPNFDRIARLYRWAEYLSLGPFLQQTRTSFLDRLSGCRNALLFGDGDGRFAARLLARYPSLQATAVDTSAAMLRLLQNRCRRAASDAATRLTALHASALETPVPPTTDLVVTHFFLDCLTQADVHRLAVKIAASAQPGTLWLLSDFEVPASPFIRGAARLYIRSLYFAFRLLTGLEIERLPDPQAALAASGFRCLARRRKLFGLLYSELWVLERPTSHGRHNPSVPALIHTGMDPHPVDPEDIPSSTGAGSHPVGRRPDFQPDPQPDPEPSVPSLSGPDPGVFHHEPARLPPSGNRS